MEGISINRGEGDSEVYSGPIRTSKMEVFAKTVNGFQC